MNGKIKSFLDLCILFLLLIGTLTLIGWFFHINNLVKISPHFAAMPICTAVCFILSGLLLLVTMIPRNELNKNWSMPLTRALTGLILFISSAYLVEHIFSLDLGIDFSAYHQVMCSNGRSAINSVIGF